jgi:Na+/H+-dicarboxylate symporter
MNNLAMAAGLILGLLFGLIASLSGSDTLMAIATGVAPLGTLFINAVRMVVIPLVAAIIFVGVAKLGDPRKLGKLGGTALGFIWATTIPAILLGMGLMKLALLFAPPVQPPAVGEEVAAELPGMLDFVLHLIPANPFQAAAEGALLPLIVFVILFSAAASTLPDEKREELVSIADSISESLIRLVHWILWTAPVGIFGLSAPATAQAGLALLQTMGLFILVVMVGTFLFMAAVYLPLVRFLGGIRPLDFIRGSVATYTIGFTTTSSVASLPVLFEDAEKMGISTPVASLVLPLAASLNRAGTALFQGASILFLAYLFDVSIPPSAVAAGILATFFVAMTVAPVPSAGVVTLAPALDAVGVPLAGMGILLGIDRIPDMFRSATNITGHLVASAVVEGTGAGRVESSDLADVAPELSG